MGEGANGVLSENPGPRTQNPLNQCNSYGHRNYNLTYSIDSDRVHCPEICRKGISEVNIDCHPSGNSCVYLPVQERDCHWIEMLLSWSPGIQVLNKVCKTDLNT